MIWLAGLLIAVLVASSVVVGRGWLARFRRNRLIRSSIGASHGRTRSLRSEMRGDSHHDTIVGMMNSTTSKSRSPKSKQRR
jgi:hypothetical protein